MAEAQTEDVPYQVDKFAVADEPTDIPDEINQLVNDAVLKEIRKYLDEAIVEEDSIDQIDLQEQAKMTPTQQIAVHKLVKNHLVNIKEIITNKIEEN